MDRFSAFHAFVNVVDAGSFSRAGERTGIAKSLLSRRVNLLETYLGTQLLQRTTRRIALTEAGRQFYRRATQILADLDEAESEVRDEHQELKGLIRLAAPVSFGIEHLAPVLASFLTEHPAIELDIDVNDRQINLVEEGVDLALRIGVLDDSSLVARRLAPINIITCASRDYLEKHGMPRHPGELPDHLGLHYSVLPLRQQWRFTLPGGTAEVHIPRIHLHANNGDMLREAAIGGAGITRAPTFIMNEAVKRGDLVPILGAFPAYTEGMFALFPPGRLLPRRVRVFADFLAEAFGDNPYWDECLTV